MSHELFDAAASAYVDAVGDTIEFNGKPVRAVLGAGWVRVASGEVRVSSRRPDVYVRFADLPWDANALKEPPASGDGVEVFGREFEVVDVRPDVENVGAKMVLKTLTAPCE